MPSRRTNNFPESGRGLGHVTRTIFGSTVGYPSDSLASCILCYVLLWRNKRWMDIDELLYYWLLYIHWLLLTKEHCPKPDETKQEISDKTNKDEHQSSVKCLTHRLIAFFCQFCYSFGNGHHRAQTIRLHQQVTVTQRIPYCEWDAWRRPITWRGRVAMSEPVGMYMESSSKWLLDVGDGLTQFSYYYSQLYKRLSVSHHKWVYSV